MSNNPFNNPFAGLAGQRSSLPAGKAPAAAASPKRRAVVRYERKGHGGKEATRVTHLCSRESEAKDWLKQLKQKLGCGGVTEGPELVLQGDQRERLPKVLETLGVDHITVS